MTDVVVVIQPEIKVVDIQGDERRVVECGVQGPPGPAGGVGETGPQGPQGPKGDPGVGLDTFDPDPLVYYILAKT